jgi:hypothetical protein
VSIEQPVNREEALAHIEAFKQKIGWQFPAPEVPASPPKRLPEAKPKAAAKLYERCSLCEGVLEASEQPDGVCLACLRKHQTPPLLFGNQRVEP